MERESRCDPTAEPRHLRGPNRGVGDVGEGGTKSIKSIPAV